MLTSVRIFVKRMITHWEYTQVSTYARWSHRRPAHLLNQEKYENEQESSQQFDDAGVEKDLVKEDYKTPTQVNWKYSAQHKLGGLSTVQKKSKPKKKNKGLRPTSSSFDMLQTVINADGEITYTKMANNDQRISMLMTTVKLKNERVRKNLILLEGKRLIKDALESKCALKYLLFSRKDDLEELKSVLPKSGASVYKMPYREMQLWSDLTHCPGVMGIFEHPVVENFKPLEDAIPLTVICDNIREPGNLGSILRICAGVGCQHVILTKGCVNLWDTKVTRSGCGAHFRLRIHTKLEWPEIEGKINARSSIFMADHNTFGSSPANVYSALEKIPLLPYYSVPFRKNHNIVVIIGGETEGLSEEAYTFVHKFNGGRLNIPLGNGVESLNSGVAAGIILFEIRKQMLMVKKDHLLASTCTG